MFDESFGSKMEGTKWMSRKYYARTVGRKLCLLKVLKYMGRSTRRQREIFGFAGRATRIPAHIGKTKNMAGAGVNRLEPLQIINSDVRESKSTTCLTHCGGTDPGIGKKRIIGSQFVWESPPKSATSPCLTLEDAKRRKRFYTSSMDSSRTTMAGKMLEETARKLTLNLLDNKIRIISDLVGKLGKNLFDEDVSKDGMMTVDSHGNEVFSLGGKTIAVFYPYSTHVDRSGGSDSIVLKQKYRKVVTDAH